LDADDNPLSDLFTTKLDQDLLALGVERDTDWRKEAKGCRGSQQLRAALVQRVGEIAPPGEACDSCGKGFGPFDSCVVAVAGKNPVFGGSCGNCAFNAGGVRCSFSEFIPFPFLLFTIANFSAGDRPPVFFLEKLESENPDHPLLRDVDEIQSPPPKTVSTPTF
jgi:hypothetical protein